MPRGTKRPTPKIKSATPGLKDSDVQGQLRFHRRKKAEADRNIKRLMEKSKTVRRK